MNSIAMLPAAIYYIRPEVSSPVGTVVYCDTDSPTAPFGLSDTPTGRPPRATARWRSCSTAPASQTM